MACFDVWDIGACGCGPPPCAVTITGTIKGCNSLVLPGVTVKAYQPNTSGTLLATTTTDGSGNFTITADQTNGLVTAKSILLQFSKARLTTSTYTLSYSAGGSHTSSTWSCGTTPSAITTQTLAVASPYICITGCADPTVATLHLTDSVIGSATLTYSSGAWIGNKTYSYPGCYGCAAASVSVAFSYAGSGNLTVQYPNNFSSCPGTPFAGTIGPYSIGALTSWSTSCAPYAMSFSVNAASFVSWLQLIYCMTSGTVNYTVTE